MKMPLIDKRALLASSLIFFAAPTIAADSDEIDQEWGVFTRLAKLFVDLQAATDPIANGITRMKFVRFLNEIAGPLTDLLREKKAVESALSLGTCTGDAVTIEKLAGLSATAIIPLVSEIEKNVRTLATAIKPAGSRQVATTLANQLGGLGGRKMWVYRTSGFCSRSPAERAAFLQEVRRSILIVESAQTTLDKLIDQLSA